MLGAINVDTISDFTPPTPAGLFFCLASAEGAGLLFLPDGVQATYKRLQHVLCSPCSYITHAAKQRTGLHSGVSVNLTHSSAHNTAATQAFSAPPTTRRRAYRQALHLHRYQIPPTHWTLYRAAQPTIIIRYIEVQWCVPVMDPCPAVQHSTDYSTGGGSVHPACILCRGQPGGLRSSTGQQSERTG